MKGKKPTPLPGESAALPNLIFSARKTVAAGEMIRMELLTALTDYQLSHPMDRGQVLRMGKELAGALEFCRKKGLIHRDVKPANIFVDEFGHFKLGDFGVARSVKRTVGGLSKKGTEPFLKGAVPFSRCQKSLSNLSIASFVFSCVPKDVSRK